jgi:hypothetical protein
LPLRAETAISSASPLNGTTALVAAVTLKDAAAAAAGAEAPCGWTVAVVCTAVPDESAVACAAALTG